MGTVPERLLRLKLEGPGVAQNRISVDDLTHALKELQLASKRLGQVLTGSVSRVGPGQMEKEIVSACSLNVVALNPGSFEVCLAPAITEAEGGLWPAKEPLGYSVIDKLTEGLDRLRGDSPAVISEFDYGVLVALRDMTRLLTKGVTSFGLEYRRDGSVVRRAVIDREVRQRIIDNITGPSRTAMEIKGELREVNLEDSTFRIYRTTTAQNYVLCRYEECHQPAVKEALDRYVKVTGEAEVRNANGQVDQLKVADVEVAEDDRLLPAGDDGAAKKRMTARDLLRSGLVGVWKDRLDIQDSHSFARKLREQAQQRHQE